MTTLDTSGRPTPQSETIHTDVPARLDALPWSRWHLYIVVALGITWVLDGLEVTLSGSVGSALTDKAALGLSNTQVGFSATAYLIGAVVGALGFGYATDRFGRRKLFFLTLILYVSATAASALSWSAGSYFLFRALTGAGIGGEYSAINSAVDELIPARVRGRVDLLINSTFWLGAALGSGATTFLLNPAHLSVAHGWRLTYGIGAVLGVGILFLRESVPESPRWLIIHGQKDEADRVVAEVEAKARRSALTEGERPSHKLTEVHPRDHTPWRDVARVMLVEHRRRSLLGLALMVSQAFFYNGVGFFTYTLILKQFFHLQAAESSWHLLPFAVGNMLGPILLGWLFDVVGRKPMIIATYAGSGAMMVATGLLFERGVLTPVTLTLCWTSIFFVASCAASSAYLTVSEIFPLEMRGVAISIFYALGTLLGGVPAPLIFGRLIDTGSLHKLFGGLVLAAGLMAVAAVAEAIWGVAAEGKSLEEITAPTSRS
jgi:MFS family permease